MLITGTAELHSCGYSSVSGGETPARSAEAEAFAADVALATYNRAFHVLSPSPAPFPAAQSFGSFAYLIFEINWCGVMSVLPLDEPTENQLIARRLLDEARQALRDRKRLTRRKIVAGAAMLTEAAHDPAVRQVVCAVLQARVTRPLDRAVIADLIDG